VELVPIDCRAQRELTRQGARRRSGTRNKITKVGFSSEFSDKFNVRRDSLIFAND
jgi:hypothetical protein